MELGFLSFKGPPSPHDMSNAWNVEWFQQKTPLRIVNKWCTRTIFDQRYNTFNKQIFNCRNIYCTIHFTRTNSKNIISVYNPRTWAFL